MVMPVWRPGPNYMGSPNDPAIPSQFAPLITSLWGAANNSTTQSLPPGGGNTNWSSNWAAVSGSGMATQTLVTDSFGILVPAGIFSWGFWSVWFAITGSTGPATGTVFQLSMTSQFGLSSTLNSSFPIYAIGNTAGTVIMVATFAILVDTRAGQQRLNPRANHSAPGTLSITNSQQQLFLLNGLPVTP